MNRILRTAPFTRWMKDNDVDDASLEAAVQEMGTGLIDASLGGHLYKKRVALHGRGKRGGARTIVATRHEGTWFFLFGFRKNERSSITDRETKALQQLAKSLLGLSESELEAAIKAGDIQEVTP